MSIDFSQLVDGEYKIIKELGSGGFGRVFQVEDKSGKKYAAKFEKRKDGFLAKEHKVLKKLNANKPPFERHEGYIVLPKVYAFTTHGRYKVLILQLLGKDLSSIFKDHHKRFSSKTLIMIGIQMIRRLEFIHECGLVHRDIKPDNMMVGGHKSPKKSIYLIDYGLATMWRSKKQYEGFAGTKTFSSINACLNILPSRVDDLESFLYSMVYFSKGALPWNKMKDVEEIVSIKKNIRSSHLMQGMPKVFREIHRDIRSLKYDSKPDYEKYRTWFKEELHKMGIREDKIFDWYEHKLSNTGDKAKQIELQ